MKNIFYATKLDKNGNKLTVGYLTSKNRERYAKDGNYADTVYFADFNDSGKLLLTDIEGEQEPRGHIMRGMLVNNNYSGQDSAEGGPFVLYGKLDGVWSRTPFSFNDFSSANSSMKAMIGQYQAMLIRDESSSSYEREKDSPDNSDLTVGE